MTYHCAGTKGIGMTSAGIAIALGGLLRDAITSATQAGGETVFDPAIGYSVVYHLEIALLFLVLVAAGPLVRRPERGKGFVSEALA